MRFKNLILMTTAFVLSSASVLAQNAPVYDDVYRKADEQEVKYFIDDSFSNALKRRSDVPWMSGWKDEQIGAEVVRVNGEGGGDTCINDTSKVLPTRFEREFEPAEYGKITMEMRVKPSLGLDGAYWSLNSGKNQILLLKTVGEDILFANNGAVIEKQYKNDWYTFRINMDVDKMCIEELYLNGVLKAENVPFTTQVSQIDNIVMGTSDTCVGTYQMDHIKIYRGYKIHDYFTHNTDVIPEDWEIVSGSPVISEKMIKSGDGEAFAVKKSFDEETRKTTAEFYIEAPENESGMSVSLNSGENRIFSVLTTEDGFAYETENEKKDFYKRVANVIYDFKVTVDFDSHTADLYMNNRLMQKGILIPESLTGTDNLTVVQDEAGNSGVTGVTVLTDLDYEDYVPEIVVPEKDDLDIIMQMCPMWNEGYHFGYDFLKASPGRMPLIGPYDESSSEAADWNIKYMVEHGVDARESIWYRTSGGKTPVREYELQSQYKAMQNARYADKMKWFVKWENSGGSGGDTREEDLENFLTNVAPFWIEYYFKDPNYYRINDRPVVGFYYFWSLNKVFGDDIPEGVKKFRELCIEFGAGDPIIVSDANESLFESVESYGFDVQSYYTPGGVYPNDNTNRNAKERDIIKEKGYSFQSMPVIAPGFSDYAWQLSTGPLWNKEMMKKALLETRDNYFKDANLPLGQKMLRLATWDEYGEGHYFAPTQDRGFDFMDAVYEVFVGDKPHTDVLPTDSQVDRINNKYPSWKNPKYYYEAPYSETVPADRVLVHKWDFDKDSEGWELIGGNAEVKDGCIKLTAVADAPIFAVSVNKEISNVTHIKVRIKNNSSANTANLMYITNLNQTFDGKKTVCGYIEEYNDDFVDLVYPTEKYPIDWRGVLDQMQIRFRTLVPGEEIIIDSIEMYEKKSEADKAVLRVNGYEQYVESYIQNGNRMVPIRKLTWGMLFDDLVYYDEQTSSVMYKSSEDNTVVIMPLNHNVFTVNGNEYVADEYYKCVDGTCFVSEKWAELVYDKEVVCENGVFDVIFEDDTVAERPVSERELIWEATFDDDMEGFSPQGGFVAEVADSVLSVQALGGDPGATDYDFARNNIDCSQVKKFVLRTNCSTNASFKIYFATTTHPSLSESCAFNVSVNPSSDMKEYVFDMSNVNNWDGVLTIFRFDTETKNSVLDIDYMRLYGDYEELTPEEIAERTNAMIVSENEVRWDFEINNKKDGLRADRKVQNFRTENGELCFEVIDKNATLTTIKNFDFDAKEFNTIKLGMKNKTAGQTLKIRFITDKDTTYSSDKEFLIELKPNDEQGTEYVINTEENAMWDGKIVQMKLVLPENIGESQIDYIICE